MYLIHALAILLRCQSFAFVKAVFLDYFLPCPPAGYRKTKMKMFLFSPKVCSRIMSNAVTKLSVKATGYLKINVHL